MLVISVVEKGLRLDLEKYLYGKLNVHAATKEGALIFDARISNKDAKRLLKRFLHQEGKERDYRITSSPQGFAILPIARVTKRRREKDTSPPPPSRTLPYFFP